MKQQSGTGILVLLLTGLLLTFGFCGSAIAQEQDVKQAAAKSYNMGIEALQKGDTTDAVTYFKAAVGGDESLSDAHYNLGSIYFAQNNLVDAAKSFKKVTELDPASADGFLNYGKVLYVQEKYDDALAAYQGALAADANNGEAQKELGKLYYKLTTPDGSNYDKSIDMLTKYIKHDSTDYYTYYMLGLNYKKKKKNTDAIASFQKAIKLNPNDFESLYNLGGIYLSMERFSDAISSYEKALKVRPKHFLCARKLAIAIQSRDPENYDAIIAGWERFVSVASKSTHPDAKKFTQEAEQLLKQLREAKALTDGQ